MACASGPPAGENSFLLELERVRMELRERVITAHQVLQDRQAELLSELQQLEDDYRGGGVYKQIRQLEITKEQNISTLTDNENKDLLLQSLSLLDTRMRRLESNLVKNRIRMKRVVLEWDRNLERILSTTGSIQVRSVPDYRQKEFPVMTAGRHGYEMSATPGDFKFPGSIAIDCETNYIYICDGGNSRVQVFDRSLQFVSEFCEEMMGPVGICINSKSTYVTQLAANCVTEYTTGGRYVQSVGGEGSNQLEFASPRGIAVSGENGTVYVCELLNNRIQCLNLNLTFKSFIREVPYPRDVHLTSASIVVLTEDSLCVKLYNYNHQLTRELIPHGEGQQVVDCWFLCVDRDGTILITDYSENCVLIFSASGELIHRIGSLGESRGYFVSPRGIGVDSEGRVIVVSYNPDCCIQAF